MLISLRVIFIIKEYEILNIPLCLITYTFTYVLRTFSFPILDGYEFGRKLFVSSIVIIVAAQT